MVHVSQPLFPYGRRPNVVAADPAALALEVSGLRVIYPGAESGKLALRDLSLRVPAATRVALVGPNGAGKSTLLKAVAGLLPVHKGEIRIYGHLVGACPHRVAYLPQRGEIDWQFPIDVRGLVMTGRYVHLGWLRRPSAQDRAVVETVLRQLGLLDLADRQIGQLSGGQQQRVLLARALAQDADLLLLDEPMNAVDVETRAVVSEVLAELQQHGKTAVVATHDHDRLDREFDAAVYLNEGKEMPPPLGAFVGVSLSGQMR